MPILIPSEDNPRWDKTPRTYVYTVKHKVASGPPLAAARRVQEKESYGRRWCTDELRRAACLC